jgi:hypothetical protein
MTAEHIPAFLGLALLAALPLAYALHRLERWRKWRAFIRRIEDRTRLANDVPIFHDEHGDNVAPFTRKKRKGMQ